ncbi:AraC family transcriptional regulator [soil metagenome]
MSDVKIQQTSLKFMEPLFKKHTGSFASFTLKDTVGQSFDGLWHTHEEYELIYICEGKGDKVIGDNMSDLRKGDLLFLGPNLPHLFRCNQDYPMKYCSGSLVIHINNSYLCTSFFSCPEFEKIQKLFKRSKSGIQFKGNTERIGRRIKNLFDKEKSESLLEILFILNDLAKDYDQTLLASPGFTLSFGEKDYHRINIANQYVMEYFKTNISLEDVAAKVGLTKAAFCRHFKKVTGKTFFTFLKEYRIGYACKLLIYTDMNVSEISYECGFNTISNFNKQFKTVTNTNPKNYQNQFSRNVN